MIAPLARTSPPRSPLRRAGFTLATIVLVLGTLELIAWLAFATGLRAKHFRWRDLDALGPAPTQAEIDSWRQWGWDRELGWLRRPGTHETVGSGAESWSLSIDARGARREPFSGPGGLVSAYGDSFTFGHDLGDDQTWPHFLSERLQSRVDNWAQSAWGPDQAVLRLRRNLPAERTAVVVLAVMSENIARLLNCYRPFLTGEHSMRMAFKPMLTRADDGGLAWLPNPMARADVPADWSEALARATASDHWYVVNRERLRPHFPYLLALPAALAWVARHPVRPNLYDDPEAVARMDYVVDELRGLAARHDFTPVVLFIPEPSDLRRFAHGSAPRYQGYVAALRERSAGSTLVVLDLLDHPFEPARFNRRPFKDHPSPYGQQVIARVVQEAIVARNLDAVR